MLKNGRKGGSIGLIPCTPPVRLTLFTAITIGPSVSDSVRLERFLNTSGTISPKPSVTMAR